MAGVDRQLTGHATTALVCVGVLAVVVLWMWVDFYYIRSRGDIGGAVGVVFLLMIAFLTLLYGGRRVVVLADGSVIGELMSGRAQRFASLEDFRAFVGA
jgi:hypothetical protein